MIIAFFLTADLGYKKTAMALVPLFIFATLSVGPLLWLYVKSVVGVGELKITRHLFVPFVFGALSFLLLLLIYIDFNEQFSDWLGQFLTYLTIGGLTIAFVFQNGYYLVKCFGLYKKHLKNVGDVFSYTEKVSLSWLKLVVYGYLIFILCLILSNLMDNIWSDIIFNSVLLAYVIYSGNNAINYEPIFTVKVGEVGEVVEEEEGEKLKEVDVDNAFFVQLKQALEESMLTDKLYLDKGLTIHSLATELKTNSKYLSQLINGKYKMSFVVFVNSYRVAKAKQLLVNEDKKHLTIEAIGHEAGFNSKSTFNLVFKKNTGETPSSFLKKGK
jgi:AraC-like DNA-binding protein